METDASVDNNLTLDEAERRLSLVRDERSEIESMQKKMQQHAKRAKQKVCVDVLCLL
jgi:hypothetical protein